MDSPREMKINGAALSRYSTELRNEFSFAANLNSIGCSTFAERAWLANFLDSTITVRKRKGKKDILNSKKTTAPLNIKLVVGNFTQLKEESLSPTK